MSDKAAEIIARGDPKEILSMALGARFAAEEGRMCECASPSLTELDLMCGNCLLENEGQIEKREAAHRAPHAFVMSTRSEALRKIGMCDFCTGWKDDPRHVNNIKSPRGME